jgi:hypothetical protein
MGERRKKRPRDPIQLAKLIGDIAPDESKIVNRMTEIQRLSN